MGSPVHGNWVCFAYFVIRNSYVGGDHMGSPVHGGLGLIGFVFFGALRGGFSRNSL